MVCPFVGMETVACSHIVMLVISTVHTCVRHRLFFIYVSSRLLSIRFKMKEVVLGGPVVIVLAIGLNVLGFKSDRGRWIFKVDKMRSTTSFGVK
jgi:hypothetical protein